MLATLTSILGAIPTLAIAVFLAYIAYQQFHVNRAKLQLDLYDRRLKIYQEMCSFFRDINYTPIVPGNSIATFAEACDQSRFLFSEEMESYLNSLLGEAHELQVMQKQTEEEKNLQGGLSPYLADSMTQSSNWFREEFPRMKQRFARYMDVNQFGWDAKAAALNACGRARDAAKSGFDSLKSKVRPTGSKAGPKGRG